MREIFWLDDQAWEAIRPHLPSNQPGARRVDDRRIISGIIHVLKSSCRWKNCPRDYPEFRARRGRFQFQALMAFVKRSPNMMAICALAAVHSRGDIFQSFSARFKTRNRSFSAAPSLGKCPLARTARRSLEFKASMALVTGMMMPDATFVRLGPAWLRCMVRPSGTRGIGSA